MDFGQALAAVKTGSRITREGWNGKGMFVVHQKGYPDGIAINRNTAEATGIAEGTVCAFRPYLMMRTADGDFVPWVASQTDILADDWLLAGGPVTPQPRVGAPVQVILGRIVHYKLSASDVDFIDRYHPLNRGHRVRNPVHEGQVLPAEVVALFPSGDTVYCNLKVSLDGEDTYWVTSRSQGDAAGQWA